MIGITPDWFTLSGMYVEDPAVHPAADDAFREGDRDPALALLHRDDGDEQDEREGDDEAELEVATLGEHRSSAGGDAGDHVGEDQDGHAVADPALGDQLAEPHDEAGARREGEDDEGGLPVGEVRDQVDAGVADPRRLDAPWWKR